MKRPQGVQPNNRAPDGYPYKLPQPAGAMTYRLNGTQVGRGNILNIAGAGITAQPLPDGITYNISGGGGGAGNPSAPFNSIQYNNAGVFGGDTLATRDPGTKETHLGLSYNGTSLIELVVDQTVVANIPFAGSKVTVGANTAIVGTADLTFFGGGAVGVMNYGLGTPNTAQVTVQAGAAQMDWTNGTAAGAFRSTATFTDMQFQSGLGPTPRLYLSDNGVVISGGWGTYYMPVNPGAIGDVITKGAGNTSTWAAPSAGGITIGNPVVGGTADYVLYIDNAGNLFGDANFKRDSTTNVTRILTLSGVQAGYTSGLIMDPLDVATGITLKHYNLATNVGSTLTLRDRNTSLVLNDPSNFPGENINAGFVIDTLGVSPAKYIQAYISDAGAVNAGSEFYGDLAEMRMEYTYSASGNTSNKVVLTGTTFTIDSDINSADRKALLMNFTTQFYSLGGDAGFMNVWTDEFNTQSGVGMRTGFGNQTNFIVDDGASSFTASSNGIQVLYVATSSGPILIGYGALSSVTTGQHNVGIGFFAGDTITTGDRNVIIGPFADVDNVDRNDSIALGFGAITTADNQMVIGSSGSGITDIYIGHGVTNSVAIRTQIHSTSATGGNNQGADIELVPGSGAGTGLHGAVKINIARFEETRGNNVTAANDIILENGNLFVVTGNTQINAITTDNWQSGSQVCLVFTGTPTVKHNTAGGAGTAVMLLAGSVDLVAAADTVLGLAFDGTSWQETFRKAA